MFGWKYLNKSAKNVIPVQIKTIKIGDVVNQTLILFNSFEDI